MAPMQKHRFGLTARVATVTALACFLADAAAQSSPPKWDPHLDFEAKPGTRRSLGEADLMVPLWQDHRTLVFGNLRGRFDDHNGREGNAGLGLRRMLDGGWNFGVYGYYDRRRSESGEKFEQATFGAEALGTNWDLRANAYLPQGDRVRDLGNTTTGGASTASIVGTSITVTTAGSATVSSEERALKGFDAEVGWRVPVFDAQAPRQLRVYTGGYRFKDDVTKVEGPRVRAELTMAELSGLWSGAQLTVSAEAQDDDARGSQSFLALRLRVPLGGKDTPRRLTWQERRMTAPVVRDVDIVTQTRSAVTAVTPATVEAGTAMLGSQPVTILDSGAVADLPAAVATAGAGSVVLLSGTFNTSASVLMQTGQTLMGAGTLTAVTPSGRSVAFTTPSATINLSGSGGNFRSINAANSTTITGLTITAASTGSPQTSAILLDGVFNAHNVRITNNVLASSNATGGRAQAILLFNVNNAYIAGNTMSGNATGANDSIGLHMLNSSGTVTGNSMTASGSTSNNYALLNAATILSGSDGNVRGNGVCNRTGGSGAIGFTDGSSC
jgi:hypothetical protein